MKPRGTPLVESAPIPAGRVDRAAKVIRGVKVVGLHSRNVSRGRKGTRTYTSACLKAAAPLYEGARVYFGHRRGKRPPDEPAAGWLESARYERDGVYADLHVLAGHPRCEHLLEAAERNPALWCLSQHAHGVTRRTATGEAVDEILEVHSVDLVRRGGTTTSLFEGLPMKLAELIRGLKLRDAHRKAVTLLLEDDGPMDGEMPVPEGLDVPADDAPAADHEEALRGGFEASCNAVVAACLAGEMDCGEGMKKLGQLLKAHAKLSSGKADDGGSDDGDEPEETPVEESDETLRARIAELEAREDVRELCEELKVSPGKATLAAAARLPKGQRRALLEEFSGATPGGAKPRTQKPGGAGPTPPAKVTDGKSFAQALRGTN